MDLPGQSTLVPQDRAHSLIFTTPTKSAVNEKETYASKNKLHSKWEHRRPCTSLLWTEQQVVGSDWTFPMNRMVPPPGQANPSWKTLCTMSYRHHHSVFSEANLPCASLNPLVFILGKAQQESHLYIQKWPVMAACFLPKFSLGSSSKCHTRHTESFLYHCLGLLPLEKFKL